MDTFQDPVFVSPARGKPCGPVIGQREPPVQPAKAVATALSSAPSWPGSRDTGLGEQRRVWAEPQEPGVHRKGPESSHTPWHRGLTEDTLESVSYSVSPTAQSSLTQNTLRQGPQTKPTHGWTEQAGNYKQGAESKARALAESHCQGGPELRDGKGEPPRLPETSCKWRNKHTRQNYAQFQEGTAQPHIGAPAVTQPEAVLHIGLGTHFRGSGPLHTNSATVLVPLMSLSYSATEDFRRRTTELVFYKVSMSSDTRQVSGGNRRGRRDWTSQQGAAAGQLLSCRKPLAVRAGGRELLGEHRTQRQSSVGAARGIQAPPSGPRARPRGPRQPRDRGRWLSGAVRAGSWWPCHSSVARPAAGNWAASCCDCTQSCSAAVRPQAPSLLVLQLPHEFITIFEIWR